LKKVLAIRIPERLKREFKAKVKKQGRTLEFALNQLIEQYVAKGTK
jgi:predicted DNA-binding protein